MSQQVVGHSPKNETQACALVTRDDQGVDSAKLFCTPLFTCATPQDGCDWLITTTNVMSVLKFASFHIDIFGLEQRLGYILPSRAKFFDLTIACCTEFCANL